MTGEAGTHREAPSGMVGVVAVVLITILAGLGGAATPVAAAPIPGRGPSGGCWVSIDPASGPVGTLVRITGSNATCDNNGYGGPSVAGSWASIDQPRLHPTPRR